MRDSGGCLGGVVREFAVKPPVRELDKWGRGAYLAPRGDRLHQGIDFEVCNGATVLAVECGEVTKIGRPYSPENQAKEHYRYVQVTDANGYDVRYFYVSPSVQVGDSVLTGQVLGVSQGLQGVYPGITDHVHFEVMRNGGYVNPWHYLDGGVQ